MVAAKAQKGQRQKVSVSEFLVFTLPLLLFLFILYGSLLWNVYVSMANWVSTAADYSFTGFKWYTYLFHTGRFWVDVQNNLKWLILGVIPTTIVAIFLAYLLELAPFPGVESYVRTLILYPVAMSFVVTGTIWSWLYQPERGVFNTILGKMGIQLAAYVYQQPRHCHVLVDSHFCLAIFRFCGHYHPILLPHQRAPGDD